MIRNLFTKNEKIQLGISFWIFSSVLLTLNLFFGSHREISLSLVALFILIVYNFIFPPFLVLYSLKIYTGQKQDNKIDIIKNLVESFLIFFLILSLIPFTFLFFPILQIFLFFQVIIFVLIIFFWWKLDYYTSSTKKSTETLPFVIYLFPISLGLLAIFGNVINSVIHFPLKIGDSWTHLKIVQTIISNNRDITNLETLPNLRYDYYYHFLILSLTCFLLAPPEVVLYLSASLHIFQLVSYLYFIFKFTENLPENLKTKILFVTVVLTYFSSLGGVVYWIFILLFPETISLFSSHGIFIESIVNLFAWNTFPTADFLPKSLAFIGLFYWLTLLKSQLEEKTINLLRIISMSILSAFIFSTHLLEALLIIIPLTIILPLLKTLIHFENSKNFSIKDSLFIQLLPMPIILVLDFLSGNVIQLASLDYVLSFIVIFPMSAFNNILFLWFISSMLLCLSIKALLIIKNNIDFTPKRMKELITPRKKKLLLSIEAFFITVFIMFLLIHFLTNENLIFENNVLVLFFFSLFPLFIIAHFSLPIIQDLSKPSIIIMIILFIGVFPFIIFWNVQTTISYTFISRIIQIWFFFYAFFAGIGVARIINFLSSNHIKFNYKIRRFIPLARSSFYLVLISLVISNLTFSIIYSLSDSDRAIKSDDRILLDWINEQPIDKNYIILDPYLSDFIKSFSDINVKTYQSIVIQALYSS
ncbi:MAG: hypothetical protein ACFFDN_35805, partial [Candidatus Hodarchaeota archaeon]